MSDISDAYNRENKRRSGPFGLDKATTRIGAAAQLPLYATEGIGRFGSYHIDDLPEDATDLIFGASQGVADYLLGPSRYQRNLQTGNIPESELPLGTDLADIEGSGVGVPDFVPDDYTPGEIFTYDPTGEGLTKDIDDLLKGTYGDLTPGPKTRSGRAKLINEQMRKSQEVADAAINKKMGTDALAGNVPQEKVEDAFVSALKDYMEAAGKPDTAAPRESREDALARYKKEFEDATGIDASGKVNKSQALMAFGLALMQNKAGRGFNVGKILASVGEAGEAAMPALEKAQDRASAAKLAAGKYALQQIENDENARAALAKEQRLAAQEAQLKWLEFQQEVYLKGLEGKEIKGGQNLEIIPGLKIRVAQSNGRSVFERPEFTARTVGNAYRTTQVAMGELSKIEDAILDVKSSGSPAISIVADRFNTFLVGLGMKDPNVTFGETGVSPEQQAAALRDSLIAEFKRFLTQETGNGISNVDIQNMERLMGKMDIFGNPNDALNRVDQVRGIFEAKGKALSPFIKDLTDPYYYASDAAFAKSQTALAESMGYGGSGKMGTQSDGRVVIDLTTGG